MSKRPTKRIRATASNRRAIRLGIKSRRTPAKYHTSDASSEGFVPKIMSIRQCPRAGGVGGKIRLAPYTILEYINRRYGPYLQRQSKASETRAPDSRTGGSNRARRGIRAGMRRRAAIDGGLPRGAERPDGRSDGRARPISRAGSGEGQGLAAGTSGRGAD